MNNNEVYMVCERKAGQPMIKVGEDIAFYIAGLQSGREEAIEIRDRRREYLGDDGTAEAVKVEMDNWTITEILD